MSKGFSTAFSLAAAVAEHSRRRRTKRKINRLNEKNRNIQLLGCVTADQIIPCSRQTGNISISGGSKTVRNELIIQNCRQSLTAGIPVIIIHEGNYLLEQTLQSTFFGGRYLRIINASNPFYDPVFWLNDNTEIGHFISEASLKNHKVNSEGTLYVQALATLLSKLKIPPYLRMFAHCPFNSINERILKLEQAGVLNADEANSLRKDMAIDPKAQSEVAYYFQQLELESPILPWKSNLSRCTSISECILKNGIMAIDIGSCGRLNQLALISTEIERCTNSGKSFRVIIDAASLSGNEKLLRTLKNYSNTISWTISSPDMYCMLGNVQGELATWLAQSHRAVLFSHGIKTCECLSAELGEYDHIDIADVYTGSNAVGQIGFHHGVKNGFTTSISRKRVIRPEEIECLGEDSFIMLDNYTATISRGTLV